MVGLLGFGVCVIAGTWIESIQLFEDKAHGKPVASTGKNLLDGPLAFRGMPPISDPWAYYHKKLKQLSDGTSIVSRMIAGLTGGSNECS